MSTSTCTELLQLCTGTLPLLCNMFIDNKYNVETSIHDYNKFITLLKQLRRELIELNYIHLPLLTQPYPIDTNHQLMELIDSIKKSYTVHDQYITNVTANSKLIADMMHTQLNNIT